MEAEDEDDDTLTYTLGGTNASSFGINTSTGQLRTSAALDYEDKNSYTVTVSVRDSKDAAGNADTTTDDTITVTINVRDVDEPPSAPSAPTVTATSGSTSSLDVSWTAPANDGKPPITSYDLQYRQGTTGNFGDGPQNVAGTSTTISGLQPGTRYQVRVRATNAEGDGPYSSSGSGWTNQITPPPTPVPPTPVPPTNSAPVFADGESTSRTIPENTAAGRNVGAVIAASDPEGDALTYILGDPDASSFTITGTFTGGQLRTAAALDHETKSVHTFTATARDPSGRTDRITVTVNVSDVDEPGGVGTAPPRPKLDMPLVAALSDPDGVVAGSET